MTNISELTTNQLHKIVAIKERIEKLQGELESLVGGNGDHTPSAPAPAGKRTMSAAARAKIAAAARDRWAKVKGTAPKTGKRKLSAAGRAAISAAAKARWAKAKSSAPAEKTSKKKDRRMSPAVKAKLAEIARARWAKVKAAGKSTL
jgi:hypothetical protein